MALAQNNEHSYKRQTLAKVGLALAIGLAIGASAARIWLWLTPPSVPLADYAILVSAAYDRERLPLNAIDRLSSAGIGDVGTAMAAVARDVRRVHPSRARDIKNLDQLAEALKNQAVTPAGGKSSDGRLWWLLIPLLLVGSALVVKTAVKRQRLHRSVLKSMPEAKVPHLQKAELVGGMRGPMPAGGVDGIPEHQPLPKDLGRTASPERSRASRITTVPGRRRELVLRPFICTYHAGNEPFEDVHPILNDEGDVLIGACGLTAAAKLADDGQARYYAFTAWVHDYLSGEPMSAMGLLSPWASGRKRLALYDPALTRATLHRTERGLTTRIETGNLDVTMEVADLSYGTARDVPANSYFTVLSVRFAVMIKA